MNQQTATWRNTYGFPEEVPETAHDGHPVVILRTFVRSGPQPSWAEVRCLGDGAVFHAFTDELEEPPS